MNGGSAACRCPDWRKVRVGPGTGDYGPFDRSEMVTNNGLNQVIAECGHSSGWWGEDTDCFSRSKDCGTRATGFSKNPVAFVFFSSKRT